MGTDNNDERQGFASPPCFAHEFDPGHVDPQQALDVARWRKAERIRLLAERKALPSAARQAISRALADHLEQYLAHRFDSLTGLVVSAWWPIKAEFDLRTWLGSLEERGARAALPVLVKRAAPLAFRTWKPDTRMRRGHWDIFEPADTPFVVPDVTLVPLVGWDDAAYRLGYGGGYFDRTLAARAAPSLTIGLGWQQAKIPTIFPQPHDVPMDVIITEAGVHEADAGNRDLTRLTCVAGG